MRRTSEVFLVTIYNVFKNICWNIDEDVHLQCVQIKSIEERLALNLTITRRIKYVILNQ